MDKGEPQQVSPFFIEDATNIRQYLHHLANDNPRIFVVRYTGGTKNGVKRLSNDYQ